MKVLNLLLQRLLFTKLIQVKTQKKIKTKSAT